MSKGEGIVHFTGIRLRVNGTGNMRPTMYSLDRVLTLTLVPIPMLETTDRQLLRLANFQSQRMSLELKTTEINERFRINRVIIFAREVFTDFPSTQ